MTEACQTPEPALKLDDIFRVLADAFFCDDHINLSKLARHRYVLDDCSSEEFWHGLGERETTGDEVCAGKCFIS